MTERTWQDVARHINQKRPDSYGPYEYSFRGLELLHRLEPDEIAQAKTHFSRALELDPEFATAHLGLGFCYMLDFAFWDDPSGMAMDKAQVRRHSPALSSSCNAAVAALGRSRRARR